MDERDIRERAVDRVVKHFELLGQDEPDHSSEEWRELVAFNMEDIR